MFNTVGFIGEDKDALEAMSFCHVAVLKGNALVTYSAAFGNCAKFVHTQPNIDVDDFLVQVDGPIFIFENFDILQEIDLKTRTKRTIITEQPVSKSYLNLEFLPQVPKEWVEQGQQHYLKISGGDKKLKLKFNCILNKDKNEN